MLLDTSLDAKCISPRTVDIRDLSLGEPEYAEEIYQYLKTAEVSRKETAEKDLDSSKADLGLGPRLIKSINCL